MARWSVDIIGKRFQHLGTVVADDERRALEETIRQFVISPHYEANDGDKGR
jgi:hypothetical protein